MSAVRWDIIEQLHFDAQLVFRMGHESLQARERGDIEEACHLDHSVAVLTDDIERRFQQWQALQS